MQKPTILVVWSNYYPDLAQQQLNSCLPLLDNSPYQYKVETVTAGSYELPAVIRHFQKHNPFDAYIPLSLLLKGSTDHYEFIWEHVKDCFRQFAMEGILLGNGVITASTMALLESRVENGERVHEAYKAVDYLLQLKIKQHEKPAFVSP